MLIPGRCARALHIVDLCLDMEFKSLENHADQAGQYMEKKTCFWTTGSIGPTVTLDVKEWLQVIIREEAQYTKQLQIATNVLIATNLKPSVEPDNCL